MALILGILPGLDTDKPTEPKGTSGKNGAFDPTYNPPPLPDPPRRVKPPKRRGKKLV